MAFVWQISIVQFSDKNFISGVILKGEARRHKKTLFSNLGHVITSYLKKPYRNKQILVAFGKQNYYTETDDHGSFALETEHEIPEEIKLVDKEKNIPIPISQTYPDTFPESEYPLVVISDIDDTLLVSHTASNWNRIKTILFTSPKKRKPVSFTSELLNIVRAKNGRIFYVSKSESNLFNLLTTVIQKHDLPAGSLFLTPYLIYNQLFHPKKGKDFKEKSIRRIIDHSPKKRFILMGDDTQQDMLVYAKIAEHYPESLVKIYIRKTRKQLFGNKLNYLNKLRDTGVPLLYFTDQDTVENEIQVLKELIPKP